MKLSKNKLGVLVAAALGLGVAGQASADVYGLSTLAVDNLAVVFTGSLNSAPTFTFNTNQDASLNGVVDISNGAATCAGIFGLGNDCGVAPRLSGTVQNAPGGSEARGENDYQVFGLGGNYSNAEAAIITAALLGDGLTSTNAISESNISSVNQAQANTSVGSNTFLSLNFDLAQDGGAFNISFSAVIDVLSQATGIDINAALAQANSGLTVVLTKAGETLASWAPTGTNNVTSCGAGLVCTATETAGLSLNNSTSSFGPANQEAGSGRYSLDVEGLTSGLYTLALATTTSTDLRRFPMPVPGTLFLMGAGLLAAARAVRRNKSAV